MKHNIDHNLDFEKAKETAKRALESYRERFSKYSPDVRWRTETEADLSFQAAGQTLSGTISVHDDRFSLELDVPFLMRPFKSKALSIIEKEVRTWIGKANAGEF